MEYLNAFVIAHIISSDGNPHNDKYRILDLTPDIKNNVVECTRDWLEAQVKRGVKPFGVEFSEKYRQLVYFGKFLDETVPSLKDISHSHSKYKVALAQSLKPDGTPVLILANYKGDCSIQSFKEAFEADKGKFISNIEFGQCITFNDAPTIVSNGVHIGVFTPNSGHLNFIKPEGHKNTPKDGGLSPSEKEELCNSWITTERFIELLNKGGYRASFSTGFEYLSLLEWPFEVLNLPNGIRGVLDIFAGNPGMCAQIKRLRVPTSVTSISDIFISKLTNLESIEYEDRTGSCNSSGYLNLSFVNKIYNIQERKLADFIPSGYSKLEKLGNGKDLGSQSTDLSGLECITELHSCFYSMESEVNGIKLPPNTKIVDYSLYNLSISENSELVIPASVESICDSFNSLRGIKTIRFESGSKLKTISTSFCDLDIEELDLSMCKGLKNCDKIAAQCKNLRRVKFPEQTISVGYSSFEGSSNLSELEFTGNCPNFSGVPFMETEVKTLEIPESVSRARVDIHKLTVLPRKVLTSGLLSFGTCDELVLSEGIEEIELQAFRGFVTDRVTLPSTLKKVSPGGLYFGGVKYLDMYNSSIKVLYKSTIECGTLEYLALPRGLEELKQSSICNLFKLKRMYISSSVKVIEAFDKSAVAWGGGAFVIAVVKGSVAETLLKRRKLNIVSFDSDEEAYEFVIGNNNVASKKFQTKMKLVASGTADPIIAEIMSERYIANSAGLYRVYGNITSEIDELPKEDLDTSKFKDIVSLDELSTLGSFKGQVSRASAIKGTALNPVFIKLCNLLTKSSTPFKPLMTAEGWKQLDSGISGSDAYCRTYHCYSDDTADIVVFGLRGETMFESWCILITVIAIFNTVKFVYGRLLTPEDAENYALERVANYGINFNIPSEYKGEHPTNLGKTLSVGDTISFYSSVSTCVSGLELPSSLYRTVSESYKNRVKPLAAVPIKEPMKSVQMDMVTGEIYLAEFTNNRDGGIYCISDFVIKDKQEKASQEMIEILMEFNGNNSDKLLEIYFQQFMREKYLKFLSKQDNAYSEDIPCKEFELGKLFSSYSIDSIAKLNYTVTQELLDTAFFCKVRKSLKSLCSLDDCDTITLSDGSQLLTFMHKKTKALKEMVGATPKFVSVLLEAGTAIGEVETCYISCLSPTKVLSTIRNLPDYSKEKIVTLTNEEYNTDNFLNLDAIGIEGRLTICISIAKCTGFVFLTVINRDGECFLVYRLDTVQNAEAFFKELRKDASDNGRGLKSNKFKFLLEYTAAEPVVSGSSNSSFYVSKLKPLYDSRQTNYIHLIRDKILKGLPRGAIALGKPGYILSLISRQKDIKR